MFHRQPPYLLAGFEPRDDGVASAARSEEASGGLGVADRRGEPDASRAAARDAAQAFDKTERLHPAVPAQQRVDLVDHYEAQVAEKGGHFHVPTDEHRLEGLRRDLQDASRVLDKSALGGARCVPMPACHGDVRIPAQFGEAFALVVDERLQRREVEHSHARGRILVEQREDREERGFGLPGCCRGGEQDVLIGVEDRIGCGVLHAAQLSPAGAVNVVLDERREALEGVHSVNSA